MEMNNELGLAFREDWIRALSPRNYRIRRLGVRNREPRRSCLLQAVRLPLLRRLNSRDSIGNQTYAWHFGGK